jgi:hypothetical protein
MSMKYAFILGAFAGGMLSIAAITYRIWDRFNTVAALNDRAAIDFNVLLVLGIGWGLYFVPIGAACGAAVVAAFLFIRHLITTRIGRGSDSTAIESEGDSWVTHRKRRC